MKFTVVVELMKMVDAIKGVREGYVSSKLNVRGYSAIIIGIHILTAKVVKVV
jgi:hypothetical protein